MNWGTATRIAQALVAIWALRGTTKNVPAVVLGVELRTRGKIRNVGTAQFSSLGVACNLVGIYEAESYATVSYWIVWSAMVFEACQGGSENRAASSGDASPRTYYYHHSSLEVFASVVS